MAPQRPQRPSTRVPQPSPGKAPTSRQPAVHSAPTTRMPTEPARGSSRPLPRHATSRGASTSSPKGSLPIILAAAGGGLLLIIIIAVAASGRTKAPAPASNPKGPKVVDVATLENDGKRKCEEGVVAIKRAYDIPDKAGLQRGVALITEGNQLLDKANQMSGHTYDTTIYNQTLKMARSKLLELK